MSLQVIEDICRRVLGNAIHVTADYHVNKGWLITISDAKTTDPLTRSQQEMDIILSLQHALSGVALQLHID
ncbi:MAG: hypothetical protein JHC38_04330 [Thiotrichales bacterium]|nr:hypothetical protein [Thiotrichales bacterium]